MARKPCKLRDGRPNLRGRTVRYKGQRWVVVTHTRGDHWVCDSEDTRAVIRLTRAGKPIATSRHGA